VSHHQSSSKGAVRITVNSPEGERHSLPQVYQGKFVMFPLRLDLTRDWLLIQLIWSLPPRSRSRMVKDMLRIVVNAAHIWLERQPMIVVKHGKKLSEEQRRKILRTKISLA